MHKFFVNKDNVYDNRIIINGEDVNHISKVLRLRTRDKIQVNALGREYICMIGNITKEQIECSIIEEFQNVTEPPVGITLFQGLPKAQKMDLIVQKCVEIGVVRIQPVITERTIVKVEYRDISNKLDRWRRISMEAAKQSDRGVIPAVLEPISFEEAANKAGELDFAVIPYENEEGCGMKSALKSKNYVQNAGIIIGPEGGFTEEEIKQCINKNIYPVTLGPRILRTETAGFVTAAIIQYEIGDMGGRK